MRELTLSTRGKKKLGWVWSVRELHVEGMLSSRGEGNELGAVSYCSAPATSCALIHP